MKCLAVSWDDKNRVVGAVAERNRNAEKPVLTGLCHATSDHTFSEQLAEVYNQLMSPEIEAVILGGHIEDAVCFELSMPKLTSHELKNALEFELPRQLPCTTDNLTVFHRRIGGKDDTALSRIRVFTVKSRVWEQLLSNIDIAGIKVDVICHPFMTVDPILQGKDVYLPGIEPDFIFRAPDAVTGLRSTEWVSATVETLDLDYRDIFTLKSDLPLTDTDKFMTAGILAAYVFGTELSADRKHLSPLPDNLRPQRCKILKSMVALLALFAGVLLLGLGYRYCNDAYHRMHAVNVELKKVEQALAVQQKKVKSAEVLGKTADKLLESVDDPNLLQLLAELTRILPENMWITNLRSSGSKITLTIQAGNDRDDITVQLNRLGDYTVENLRKQRNPDSTVTLFVSLAAKKGPLKS